MEKGSKLHLHKLKNFAILASVFEPTVVAPFILTSSPFAVANDSHLFLTHPHRVSSFFWTVKSPHNQRFPFTLIHFLISQFCYISSTPHPHANIVFRDCFISLFPFFPRSKHPPARNTNPQGSTLSQFLAPYFNSPLYFLFEFIIPVRGSDRNLSTGYHRCIFLIAHRIPRSVAAAQPRLIFPQPGLFYGAASPANNSQADWSILTANSTRGVSRARSDSCSSRFSRFPRSELSARREKLPSHLFPPFSAFLHRFSSGFELPSFVVTGV